MINNKYDEEFKRFLARLQDQPEICNHIPLIFSNKELKHILLALTTMKWLDKFVLDKQSEILNNSLIDILKANLD